jgi:GT2 family glycosyltransferase
MLPKVTVLILSYNGKQLLYEAINSYLSNGYPNYGIVVIDNGSTDGTREYVESNWKEVEVLRSKINLGYSGGLNLGLDYAFNKLKAEFAIVSNNDLSVGKGLIHELSKVAIQYKDAGFVVGKVYYYNQPDVIQTIGYQHDPFLWVKPHPANKRRDDGAYDRVEERYYSDDIVMLVRQEVYYKVGGYDHTMRFQSEQFDWQIRAKKAGFKIYYTPYARVWHKESYTIGKSSPFQTYFDVRNSLVVRIKHREKDYVVPYHKWYLKKVVLRAFLKKTLKFQYKYSWAILTGYFSALIWAGKTGNLHKILKYK